MPASSSSAVRRGFRIAGLALLCSAGCDRCTDPPTCESTASTAQVDGIWTIEGEGERAGCGDPRYQGDFELGPSLKLAIETVNEPLVDGGPRDAAPVDGPLDAASLETRPRDLARELAPDLPGKPDLASKPDLARDGANRDLIFDTPGSAPEAGLADLGRPEARIRPDQRVPSPKYRHRLVMRNPPAGFSFSGEVIGNCVSFETMETDLRGTVRYQFSGKAVSSRSIEGRFTGSGPVGCLASGTFEVEIR